MLFFWHRVFKMRPPVIHSMIVDLEKSVVDNIDDKQCVYTCREPGGSLIIGTAIAIAGIVLVPAFLDIVGGMFPFTIDGFLNSVMLSVSIAVGYTLPIPAHYLVFYFTCSFLGGMACLKQIKSVIMPLVVLATCLLVFFFLALFVLGISIAYNVFFAGIGMFMLPFAVSIVVPSLLGSLTSKGMLSAKKCHVRGKGVTVKN